MQGVRDSTALESQKITKPGIFELGLCPQAPGLLLSQKPHAAQTRCSEYPNFLISISQTP